MHDELNDGRRARFLREMGVGPLWTLRARGPVETSAATPEAVAAAPAAVVHLPAEPAPAAVAPRVPVMAAADSDVAGLDWPGLRAAIASCTACDLCRTRGAAVAGDGDDRGEWLVVGTAPDGDDEAAGTPYAGERGLLLDNMLSAAGSNRVRGAYVTTAVKCRPVGADGRDRAPSDGERDACRRFLLREIELLRPRAILALGGAHPLEGRTVPAGAVERLGDAALVAVPDPQALLAAPAAKALAWNALCLARRSDGGSA